MFSKTVGYAVRATIYLTSKRGVKQNTAPFEIAQNLNVSESYIRKILQTLTKSKIINSQKGPHGGFSATDETLKCSVYRIIEIIDNASTFNKCSLGLKECNPKHPCPIHFEIVDQRDKMKIKLQNITVLEMAQQYENSDKLTLA